MMPPPDTEIALLRQELAALHEDLQELKTLLREHFDPVTGLYARGMALERRVDGIEQRVGMNAKAIEEHAASRKRLGWLVLTSLAGVIAESVWRALGR